MNRLTPVMMALLACSTAYSGERTLESITEELESRWNQLQAFSATIQLDMDMTTRGIHISSHLSGPLVFVRRDNERPQYRSEMSGDAEGGPMNLIRTRAQVLTVMNGVHVYSENRIGDRVTVTRATPGADGESTPGGGAERLARLSEKYYLRILPDSQIGGRSAYAFEGRPKPDADLPSDDIERAVVFLDKETAILLRIILFNKAGRPAMIMQLNDINLEPELQQGAFDYTPPEGVKVKEKKRRKSFL